MNKDTQYNNDSRSSYPGSGYQEETFRDRLIRLGISQIEFAKMVGAGISTVQHWAQGKHKVPTLILDILDMIEGIGDASCVSGARKFFYGKVKRNARRSKADRNIRGDDSGGGRNVKGPSPVRRSKVKI